MHKTDFEAMFPEAGKTSVQNEIDQLRSEIMAGGHKEVEERPEQEELPARLYDMESQLIEALNIHSELGKKIEDFKERLLKEMQDNDIKSWKSDRIIITRLLPTEREIFDTKRFKQENEDIYRHYTKSSKTKESIKITTR